MVCGAFFIELRCKSVARNHAVVGALGVLQSSVEAVKGKNEQQYQKPNEDVIFYFCEVSITACSVSLDTLNHPATLRSNYFQLFRLNEKSVLYFLSLLLKYSHGRTDLGNRSNSVGAILVFNALHTISSKSLGTLYFFPTWLYW